MSNRNSKKTLKGFRKHKTAGWLPLRKNLRKNPENISESLAYIGHN